MSENDWEQRPEQPVQREAVSTGLHQEAMLVLNGSERKLPPLVLNDEGKHIVTGGETLWTLASQSLLREGSRKLNGAEIRAEVERITSLNAETYPELADPRKLGVGMDLQILPESAGQSSAPAPKLTGEKPELEVQPRSTEHAPDATELALDQDGRYTAHAGETLADVALKAFTYFEERDPRKRELRSEMNRLVRFSKELNPELNAHQDYLQEGEKIQVIGPSHIDLYKEIWAIKHADPCRDAPRDWKTAAPNTYVNVNECEKVILPFDSKAHVWKGGEAIAKMGSTFVAYPGSKVYATHGSFGLVFPGAKVEQYKGAQLIPATPEQVKTE